MLGGVRGALSIVLAATITASAVISLSDIAIIRTMALGVAFLSITFQVPILFRYVRSKFKEPQPEQELKVEEKLSAVSASIDETIQLRNERKISAQEFNDKLENFKDAIEETIHDSAMNLETKKIVKERVSMIYSSVNQNKKSKKAKTTKEE